MDLTMQARRQALYIRPIILRAISLGSLWLSILIKSIETRFGCLLYSSLLDILYWIFYYSKVWYTDSTRIDNQNLFWLSMLNRLYSQVYFSPVYILDLLVNFSRVSLERFYSRVYILVEYTPSLERDRDLLRLSIFDPK